MSSFAPASLFLLPLAAVCMFAAVCLVLSDHPHLEHVAKVALVVLALGGVFWEQRRVDPGGPAQAPAARSATAVLVLCAVTLQTAVLARSSPRFVHVWEQYHHVLGAKYFDELGYGRLYRCTLVAESELAGGTRDDLNERLIRDLEGDNRLLLAGPSGVLDRPERCKDHFSAARWTAFKGDVAYFRDRAGPKWRLMQSDHGFNPPPSWVLLAGPLAAALPAADASMRCFTALDVLLLAATFLALAWAFGARVATLALVFWVCFEPASLVWTGGSLLRFDWLFLLTLAVACTRRRRYTLAGACIAAAAATRVFPAMFVLGWLVLAALDWARHRRLDGRLRRLAAGAARTGAMLCGLVVAVHGVGPCVEFHEHTLVRHRAIPMANNMGLSTLFTYDPAAAPDPSERPPVGAPDESRLLAADDARLVAVRSDRLRRLQTPFLVAAAALGVLSAVAIARTRSLWAAPCLASCFLVGFAQLTCYYFAFLILLAPLARRRRSIELILLGAAGLSQVIALHLARPDSRYFALSVLSLGLVVLVLVQFLGRARAAPEIRQLEDDLTVATKRRVS